MNGAGLEAEGVDEVLPNAAKVTGRFATGYAIVIGVANYRNVSPLPDAVLNDARDVASVLKSNAYCGYEPRNVHLLLDGDATLERIRTALASVAGNQRTRRHRRHLFLRSRRPSRRSCRP